MKYTVHIRDYKTVTKVQSWCKENLKDDEWGLIVMKMIPCNYKFEFANEKDIFWAMLNR